MECRRTEVCLKIDLEIARCEVSLYRLQPFMRMIGYLNDEAQARLFGDYLYGRGIKNEVEAEKDGSWVIWVHGEDELDVATDLLRRFQQNPHDPEYRKVAEQAHEFRRAEEEKNSEAAKRFFDSRRVFQSARLGMGRLTTALIGITVLVFLLRELGGNKDFWNILRISNYDAANLGTRIQYGLPEVRNGQIWRLLTPIFLHFGILHIFFNMLWLRDLGSMMESRQGTGYLAVFVVAIGVCSNVAQFLISGPAFGGMSGIVFALLGFVWMKSTFDPHSGYFLHPSTVTMMLIWFAIGFLGFLPIANTVHAVGLGMGVAWGYISAVRRNR